MFFATSINTSILVTPFTSHFRYDSNIKFILSAQFQWNMHRLAKDKLEVLKTWQDDLVEKGIMGEKQ